MKCLGASDSKWFGRSAIPALVARAVVFLACWTAFAVSTAAADPAPRPDVAPSSEPAVWPEAFSSTPADLQTLAAAARDVQGDVVVLELRSRLELDAENRLTETEVMVYEVRTAAGVQGWDSVAQRWAPWHEERPEIRARVVRANGAESWLEAEHLGESPVAASNDKVYDDRRELTGPLPSVEPGSIVEQQIVVREHRPLFEAGSAGKIFLPSVVPLRRGRILLEAPTGTPLRHRIERADLESPIETQTSETADGRQRVVIEYGPLEPFEVPVSFLPYDHPRVAHVAWSTGESWAALARAYNDVVDARIAEADLAERAARIVEGATTRRERIERLLAEVHREVRYTGLSLGAASIIPAAPEQVLTRGFGDCKDKATLLVGLLRAVDVPAHVALLNASFGDAIPTDLPGIGSFNHAIVHVPAAEGDPTLWIDATSTHSPVGDLPSIDRHRWALVAAPDTTELTRTPLADASENRLVKRREITFRDLAPADMVETTTYDGFFAQHQRMAMAGDPAARRTEYEERISELFEGSTLVEVEETDVDDFSTPLRISFTVDDVDDYETFLDGILHELYLDALFENVAPDLLAETDTPRDEAFFTPVPFVLEWHWTLRPPTGMVLDSTPEAGTTPLGSASLERRLEADDDGTLRIDYRFESGPAFLSAREFEATREALVALGEQRADVVVWRPQSDVLLEAGETPEAVRHLRTSIEADPGEASHRIRLSRLLLQVGQGLAAREAARDAARLAPESTLSHWALGWALSHDLAGRLYFEGFDHAGAVRAFERALELDPDHDQSMAQLGNLLVFDDRGVERGSPDPALDRAATLLERWREDSESDALDAVLLSVLLANDSFEALEAKTKELPSSDLVDTYRLVAVALNRGAGAVPAEAAAITTDSERRILLQRQASGRLLQARRYELARAVMEQIADTIGRPPEIAQYIDLLAKTRRFSELELDDDDPISAFWRLYSQVGASEPADPETLLHPGRLSPSEETLGVIDDAMARGPALSTQKLAYLEVGLASAELKVRDRVGDEVWLQKQLPNAQAPVGMFVQRHDGRFVLRAFHDEPREMAHRALEALDAEQVDVAETWIRWYTQASDPAPGIRFDDPLSGSPFLAWWGRGGRSADDLRVASHLLALDDGEPLEGALTTLRGALERDDLRADEAGRLRLAIAGILLDDGDAAAAIADVERLLEEFPRSDSVWRLLAVARHEADDSEGAHETLDRWLEARPDDESVRRTRAMLLSHFGPAKPAIAALEELDERGVSDPMTANNMAWYHLFLDPIDIERALELTRRAAGIGTTPGYDTLHTVAAVLAEAGQPLQAYTVLAQGMASRGDEEILPSDWFVLGQIAEAHDLIDAARESYARAIAGENDVDSADDADDADDERWDSTANLARRKLAKLDRTTDDERGPAAAASPTAPSPPAPSP